MSLFSTLTDKIDRSMKDPRRGWMVRLAIGLVAVAIIVNAVITLRRLARSPQERAEQSLAIIARAKDAKDVEEAAGEIMSSSANGPLDLTPLVAWVDQEMAGKERTRENYTTDFGAVLNAVVVFRKFDTSGASLPVLARIKVFHPKDDIVTGYKYLQLEARKAELEISIRQLQDTVNKSREHLKTLGVPDPNP